MKYRHLIYSEQKTKTNQKLKNQKKQFQIVFGPYLYIVIEMNSQFLKKTFLFSKLLKEGM